MNLLGYSSLSVLLIFLFTLIFGIQGEELLTEEKKDLLTADWSAPNRYITGAEYLHFSDIEVADLSRTSKVTFTLGWDASWRDSENWDAAWIFIKVRDSADQWHHAKIKSIPVLVQNKSSDGAEPEYEIPGDQTGVFIYRASQGQGDNEWRIVLEFSTEVLPVEVKVLGLEMVYVAPGSFQLGTLKSERDRREVLTPGAGGAPYNPFFKFDGKSQNYYGGIFDIETEDAINIGKENGNLFWVDANIPGTNTFSGIPKGRLEKSFPKGTMPFYQMKYELSQSEYCDFLNTLTDTQVKARDITNVIEFNRPIMDYRNAIKLENRVYTTDRPHRPCNFISWLDGQAYADWSGLRNMTELEFEKAARGPLPAIYREYVWGVNELKNRQNMVYSTRFYNSSGAKVSIEEGNELTDGNIHASMFSYFNLEDVCVPGAPFYDPDCAGCRSFSGGDGGRGPVRKGIFGISSKGDRVLAGASYYGAMELGGNLQEPVVTVGHPSGRKFEGSHGDGLLSPEGAATNPDWMPLSQDYAFGGRGGCWKFHENHARTSDRFKGLRTKENRRASHIGFRGVRTANSPK